MGPQGPQGSKGERVGWEIIFNQFHYQLSKIIVCTVVNVKETENIVCLFIYFLECIYVVILMLQGEPGSVVSGGGIPGRKGEPGIPGSPVRNKLENGLLFESVFSTWIILNLLFRESCTEFPLPKRDLLLQESSPNVCVCPLWVNANQSVHYVQRVFQDSQAALASKVPLDFQEHRVRMVGQECQEHQDCPSRWAFEVAPSVWPDKDGLNLKSSADVITLVMKSVKWCSSLVRIDSDSSLFPIAGAMKHKYCVAVIMLYRPD